MEESLKNDQKKKRKNFLIAYRSELMEMLISKPNSWAILSLIAYRARRSDCARTGLKTGEAMIGFNKSLGMTRQNYRTAIANLQNMGVITTKTTNRGTIARLINSEVWDINEVGVTNKPTIEGNQQTTTNKKEESNYNKKPLSVWGEYKPLGA